MIKKILVLLFSLGTLSSCAWLGLTSGSKAKPIGSLAYNSDVEEYKLGWSVSLHEDNANSSFTPFDYSGAIYVADSSGAIRWLDPYDGSKIGVIKTDLDLASGVAVNSTMIFVTTTDAELVAISKATHEVAWSYKLPTVSNETPQLSGNDIIVVRTSDAQLLAFNTEDGKPLWVYQKSVPALTLKSYNTFQMVGSEVIFAGLPGGKMAVINARNGNVIWETYIASPDGVTDLDKITDIAMRPLFDGKNICVASYNGKIACLDGATSAVIWSKKFSTETGLATDEQNIYAVNVDGEFFAFDKLSGVQVWQNSQLKYREMSKPTVYGKLLLSIDENGVLYFFNRNTGELLGAKKTGLKEGVNYPAVVGSSLIYQSGSGKVLQITD